MRKQVIPPWLDECDLVGTRQKSFEYERMNYKRVTWLTDSVYLHSKSLELEASNLARSVQEEIFSIFTL